MTVTTTNIEGYLDGPYLSDPYLANTALGNMGWQTQIVINSAVPQGMQAFLQKQDKLNPLGMQALVTITGPGNNEPVGMQVKTFFVEDAPIGMQALTVFPITDDPKGMQAHVKVVDYSFMGMEAKVDTLIHKQHGKYLVDSYLTTPYLTANVCAFMGMQAEIITTKKDETGMQALVQLSDEDNPVGWQVEVQIDQETPIGMQAEAIKLTAIGMQCLATIYNTTNLRILCDFPSRGNPQATGNNAWGDPAGIGTNWKASSTEPGDFLSKNLNTDIVEEIWRSASGAVVGITVDCDTELAQGVFLDTFAILNHNFTSGATVTLTGSNDSNFSSTPFITTLQLIDENNIYYIAPTIPSAAYRYWRILISDSSNSDGFVSMGTVVFGSAAIFHQECFVDQVDYQLKDFADVVATEGYTNVANSRAQKKNVKLEFRSLRFDRRNFTIMRDLFRTRRTVLKCLWIPTPDPVNQNITARFAAWAKLVQIPTERHNVKGPNADYVTFPINIDESK